MKRLRYLLIVFSQLSIILNDMQAQEDELLKKLDQRDSLASVKTRELSGKNVVTNEVHNVFFRNIYSSNNYDEEKEFKKEISRLSRYDNKKIDSIIFIQVNAFGENVYDTSIRSNRFETFLSKKIHVNTKTKIIQNRFLFLDTNQYFTPYSAYENARLIRSSGVFHDVRILPEIVDGDTNHIILKIYIQDNFPYGLSLDPRRLDDFDIGIENVNILGTLHQLSTNFRYNQRASNQPFGFRTQYKIPNIIKKSFIDLQLEYQNYLYDKQVAIRIQREFVRPGMLYAGGFSASHLNQDILWLNNSRVNTQGMNSQLWVSRAFHLRSFGTTINAFITGLRLNYNNYTERPTVSSQKNFRFWNSNLVLLSAGYSKIKYVQDRILNGFGRTEDIPIGLSANILYGRDFTEFGPRDYYGGQFLSQYYNKNGSYINLGLKFGMYSRIGLQSQGVADFQFQQASRSMRLGKFRLRNYFNLRTTIGINHDSSEFITLTRQNGIRGANNFDFRGNRRMAISFQSNLFLPISIGGFRFSTFGLIELAKINYDESSFFSTPLRSGATLGLAVKNENLIFDVIQFQYGFYPSTSNLTQRGFLITSVIPFRFQNLDISKPNLVAYE